jgi:hypothetical protein
MLCDGPARAIRNARRIKKPEDSRESLRHFYFHKSRLKRLEQRVLTKRIYCAGVVALAEAVPADFGTLR